MIIIFSIFIASFVALLFFYLFVFSRLAFYDWKTSSPRPRTEASQPPSPALEGNHARGTSELSNQQINQSTNHPVSVIICAKNELENLKKFLPSVLEQNYPAFEVIVVNDNSTDGSQHWLAECAKEHPHLRIIENHASEKNLPGKEAH